MKISPSMMCADFIHLKAAVDTFGDLGIEYLHIDIMDGHYVPNFTLGIDYCRALRGYCAIPLDIHLMIEDVDKFGPEFAAIPNSLITFHPEVCYHPLRTIQAIRKAGARVGIAIDPALTLEAVKPLLPEVDLVCVMTVNPGYSGQRLIPQTLTKLQALAHYLHQQGYSIEIEVDGNVSWENIPAMVSAGAEVLVAGTSSIFDNRALLGDNIARMRQLFAVQSA
jgi:ribulose-phosphate 3-epimerase